MKPLYIAADHAGFLLKKFLIESFQDENYKLEDLGTKSEDSVDYPDYAKILVKELEQDSEAYGILICGSGTGMCIAANRYDHIRAAVCHNARHLELARAHNNVNVVCLGSRFISQVTALECIETFIHTSFDGGRHSRRINKLTHQASNINPFKI